MNTYIDYPFRLAVVMAWKETIHVEEVAERFGISSSTVYDWNRKHAAGTLKDMPKRPMPGSRTARRKAAVRMYAEGQSVNQIAETLYASPVTIRRYIRVSGHELRGIRSKGAAKLRPEPEDTPLREGWFWPSFRAKGRDLYEVHEGRVLLVDTVEEALKGFERRRAQREEPKPPAVGSKGMGQILVGVRK